MSRLLSRCLSGLIILLCTSTVYAQRIVHTAPLGIQSGENVGIEYQIVGVTSEFVVETALFYRFQGDLAYNRVRAASTGMTYTAMIPSVPVNAGNLEYYIVAELANGTLISLPTSSPADNPFQVTITRPPPQGPMETMVANIEFRVMSPMPGTPMIDDDLLIAVALFPQDSLAITDSIRIRLNGMDVTDQANIGPYLITLIPEDLPHGQYQVELLYRYDGVITTVTNWTFNVVSSQSQFAMAESRASLVNGDFELTARSQSTGGSSNDFVRGSTSMRGSYGWLSYSANGLLTSQENTRLQPQNRFGARIAAGNYLVLEAGHVYPAMNPLLLAGRRVYGINTQMSALWSTLNVQVVYGELNRKVPTLYNPIAELVDSTDFGGTTYRDTTYSLRFKPGGAGTHKRMILASRISFGSGRYAQLGINALKVKDDVKSISVVDSLFDPAASRYINALSPSQRAWLEQNPLAFQVELSNPTPQDNIVAGADFKLNLHGGRIQLQSDGAVSALNTNIDPGPLSQKYADELGVEIDQDILDRLDRLSWLLIINENMSSLPLRVRNDEVELFVPKGIFAYQNRLSLNYFKHSIGFQQRWIGPDYVSLANNGIRRDVAGYTISDRFRMLKNTVYMNLQFEKLWDNLGDQLAARTYTTNYGISTSWYPVNFRLPRITVSIRRQFRDNNIESRNALISPSLLDVAVRHLDVESIAPDTVVATRATPRLNKTWQIGSGISRQFNVFNMVHNVTLNLTSITTDDQRFRYGDFNTRSVSLGVQTDLVDLPIRTNLNLGYTNADAQSGLNNLKLFGLVVGGNYYLLENRNLMLTAETSIISSKSINTQLDVDDNGTPDNVYDDFYAPNFSTRDESRNINYIGSLGAEYRFLERHLIAASASITSIQVRALNALSQPNDHYFQVRYFYTF